jgi:hypothetical protein
MIDGLSDRIDRALTYQRLNLNGHSLRVYEGLHNSPVAQEWVIDGGCGFGCGQGWGWGRGCGLPKPEQG